MLNLTHPMNLSSNSHTQSKMWTEFGNKLHDQKLWLVVLYVSLLFTACHSRAALRVFRDDYLLANQSKNMPRPRVFFDVAVDGIPIGRYASIDAGV